MLKPVETLVLHNNDNTHRRPAYHHNDNNDNL